MYNFLGTFSSKDFEFAPIIAKDDLRESHSKMYCQITESYNIVQRYAIWEISHQKIKPTQQMENGRRWRDGLGREAPQATAANHPFPASDPHPSLSPIHWVCQVRLSNQFSSQVSGKTFSQLVWLSYAIQMLLQLTFLNQCNLTTRGLMSLNLRIWFNLGWPTIREPFKYYFADFFRKVGGGRGGSPKVRLSWSKTSCVQF